MIRKKKKPGGPETVDPSRKSAFGAEDDKGIEADTEAQIDTNTDAGTGALSDANSQAEIENTEQAQRLEQAGQTEQDALRTQLADMNDRLLRALAEVDNLRKRSRREVAEARRFAQADVLRPLLDVLDNFERALQHANIDLGGGGNFGSDAQAGYPGEGDRSSGDAITANPGVDAAYDAFSQGVVLIAQSFRQVLYDSGVRRIEALGHPFDPMLHEAVSQAPADENTASGTILAELQTGYTFDDLVLRASRVVVAQ